MTPLKGALATLLIKCVSICAQLGFFILIARVSSIEVVGVFAAASACWAVGRALLPLGWNIAVLRAVSVLHSAGRNRQAYAIVRAAVAETAILGASLGAILVAVTAAVASQYTLEIALASLVALLWAEIGILVAFLRAIGDLVWSQLSDGVIVYVAPLAICGAMVIGNVTINFGIIAVSYVASAALSLAFLIGTAVRRSAPTTADPDEEISVHSQRQLARRLWWNQAFSALSGRASILLGAPVAGVATTAIIEAGLRTQLVGATLAWAGGTIASPRYAVGHSNKQTNGPKILNVVTWAAMLPSILVVFILAIWGEPILGILGASYASERWAITTMAVAAVVELPASSGGYFLMMTGRERLANVSTILQLGVLVAFIVLLGPAFGAIGIASAVLIASAVRSCIVIVSLRREGVSSPLALRGLQMLMSTVGRHLRFRR